MAAADERGRTIRSKIVEPQVDLVPMTEGREIVEDYRSIGLTLRRHPSPGMLKRVFRQSKSPHGTSGKSILSVITGKH
ncbi:hypothetical protein AA309_19900 [Microvirga vignae]|uniref:Uncharacterized protein n=1 Tax=Microvirga vignae TaxID=1225564 RepID=A0A0H1R8Y2_9HYPH|nr:hypothetical protein [Microvirga vignae]KLK91514.1 hypothetical protein AA309_19900 [Microvirga vignae]